MDKIFEQRQDGLHIELWLVFFIVSIISLVLHLVHPDYSYLNGIMGYNVIIWTICGLSYFLMFLYEKYKFKKDIFK